MPSRRGRAWAVLLIAALVLAVLGVIGTSVASRLTPTTLDIPGTETSHANELLRQHFGDSAPFAILLRGPKKAIDEQGPGLVAALRASGPEVTTLSPWDRGSVQGLRPAPGRALILADFHTDIKTAVNETVPELEEILAQHVKAPVRVTQTGFASLSQAIQDESIHAAEHGELVALPFLLLILLLVFRSPVAAAIPLAFGAITVTAARGILYFLTGWFEIDAFALTVCTMMGLALGVDYALLMVSRFREEIAGGAEPWEAARRTRRTAGRTTMFAGSTLLLSMLVAMLILPGSLLISLAGTLAMVVVLSVAVATIVGPALLTLLGSNVDRWRLGKAPTGRSRLLGLIDVVLKRPLLAAAVIGALLLALAAPTVGLKTGPPSPEQLSRDAPARQDAELVDHAIGPGWDAPYQVVAVTDEGPITTEKDLAALSRFQRRLAETPGVKAVIGPAQIKKRTEPLRNFGNAALTSEGNIGPVKELGKLGRSLKVAAGGVAQLRDGISEASDGAGLLAMGADRAGDGAKLIASGLGRATTGSQRAISALERFSKGARKLEEAELTAAIGAVELRAGIQAVGGINMRSAGLRYARRLERSLRAEANETLPKLEAPVAVAGEQLQAALAGLAAMGVGRGDPNYAAVLAAVQRAEAAVSGVDPATGAPYAEGYAGLPAELTALRTRLGEQIEDAKKSRQYLQSSIHNLAKLANGAAELTKGLYKIHHAGNQLASGSERLSKAAKTLGNGLNRLSGGALALVGGINRLSGGAEALEAGLAEGVGKAAPLESGLEEASVKVISGKAKINHQAAKIHRETPGIFNSGYFVLSALEGSTPAVRERVAAGVDLKHGGQAATMLVISTDSFNTPGSIRLNKVLAAEAKQFGENADLTTGVAGGAAQLNDYSHVTRAKIPIVILAITIVTFLAMVLVLRAIPLAAIAVALNLLTVGVAFGVLTLLTDLPKDWPLGGHSYVEAVGAVMIFGIVFGLSIDYAVFLLTRMREHYDEEGDNAEAVRFGLGRTAGVITGAAAIMLAVFIVFAGASIATVSQLGVGLTVAVILDATAVRIVLLPALMLLLGDRIWWLPKPLERVLPKLNV
jgi:RND superfamily putative drug exporter